MIWSLILRQSHRFRRHVPPWAAHQSFDLLIMGTAIKKPCPALQAPATLHGGDLLGHGCQCHLLLVRRQFEDAEIRPPKCHEDLAPHAKVTGVEMRALHRFRQAEGEGYEFLVGNPATISRPAVMRSMEARMECGEAVSQVRPVH